MPPAPEGEEIVFDYATLRLTLRRHPLALLRPALARRGFMPAEELWEQRDGDVRNLIAGHLEDLTPLFGAHRRRERPPGIPLTWPAAGQFLRDVFVRSLPLGR